MLYMRAGQPAAVNQPSLSRVVSGTSQTTRAMAGEAPEATRDVARGVPQAAAAFAPMAGALGGTAGTGVAPQRAATEPVVPMAPPATTLGGNDKQAYDPAGDDSGRAG